VAAVTDLFESQPQGAPEYSVIQVGDWGGLFAGQAWTEPSVRNHLLLTPYKLLGNARGVQARNDQLKANAVQVFKTKGVTSFKTV
jgi:type III restriction enzyme